MTGRENLGLGLGRRMGRVAVGAALLAALAACGVDGPPIPPAGKGPRDLSATRTAPVTPGQTVGSDPLNVTVSGHGIVGAQYQG